ncbi:MAG: carbon-nitrogen hydrolase family protein [Bdellovibrionales bacterium]
MAKAPQLKTAVCEMTSTDNWSTNVAMALERLSRIPSSFQPDFVSFPENSLYLRLSEGEKCQFVGIEDAVFDSLKKWAKDHGCVLHLGSVPLKGNGFQYNATVLIEADGSIKSVYNKMHLFDVDIQGHRSYRESDIFKHGEEPSIIEVKGWKIGLTICYDLRFSELFHYYGRREVDVIAVPSAFTVPTGKAHWEVLLRARAIENQCYVLAAAQQGQHNAKRETYGHSLIVDPWGVIEGEATPSMPVITSTLEQEKLTQVRIQIPMKNHRKKLSTFE